MPRYFFNIFDDGGAVDEDGMVLPDLAAARQEALEGARDLACEAIHNGHLNLDHYIEVADESGTKLLTVTFREAFTVTGRD
jgi:hypothetical protein